MDISSRSRTREKQGHAQERAIIAVLAKRFPFGISLDPKLVLPLSTSTFSDIQRVMGIEGDEAEAYRRALHHYEAWTAYLRAVALSGKRYTLWGECLSAIPQIERSAARKKLIERGRWNEFHEKLYRTRMGQLARIDSLPEYESLRAAKQADHEARLAAWLERLHEAGFSDNEIALIQLHALSTTDLEATRQALDTLPPA